MMICLSKCRPLNTASTETNRRILPSSFIAERFAPEPAIKVFPVRTCRDPDVPWGSKHLEFYQSAPFASGSEPRVSEPGAEPVRFQPSIGPAAERNIVLEVRYKIIDTQFDGV